MDGPMSEVSQKDKKTNIYWRMYLDSKKMVQMSQGRDRDAGVENGCVDTEGGREDGVNWEIGTDWRAVPCMKQIASGNLLHSTGSSAQCSVVT